MIPRVESALFKAIDNNDYGWFCRSTLKYPEIRHDICNTDGVSMLGCAISKNRLEIVRFMLRDKSLLELYDTRGNPPVVYLNANTSEEMIDLLKSNDVDFTAQSLDKRNLLHFLARSDDPEVFNRFMMLGIDPLVKSRKGETAYDTARRLSNKKILINHQVHEYEFDEQIGLAV